MKNENTALEPEKNGGSLNWLLKRYLKKPDADAFFDKHIRGKLNPEIDSKDIGMYQRLSTYLFQLTHYTGLINQDIKSFRTNQLLYLVIFLIGLIVVPVWLITLEYAQIRTVDEPFISWTLIAFSSAILSIGIWFVHRTIGKIKQINDSRSNLLDKADKVIAASSEYNVMLFNDSNNGTTPGFDKEFVAKLDLNNIMDAEFDTICKSYNKYLCQNEHFDYLNLSGVIRAHHALYTNRIKTDAEQAQRLRDDYFQFANDDDQNINLEKNIEQVILKRHIDQIKKIHQLYGEYIVDMRKNKKAK